MKIFKSTLLIAVLALLACPAFAADQMITQKTESLTSPIKGAVGYTYMTDYLWHGINLTKVLGGSEGSGANVGNVGAGLDLSDIGPEYQGTVWLTGQQVYFNRFAGTDADLAKTDWAVAYNVFCPFMDGDWTFEYRNINFNNVGVLRHADADTQELSAQFAWNDGNYVKCVTGEDFGKKVLYPTIKYTHDADEVGGGLLTFGLSHPFDLSQADPALTGLTLTPSWDIVWDHRYYGGLAESFGDAFGTGEADKTDKVAYMDFGLNLGVNLSRMMNITAGKLAANFGVAYVDSVEKFLEDTLYGYAGISYNW